MIRERYDEYLGGRPVGTWSMLAPVVAGASASNAWTGVDSMDMRVLLSLMLHFQSPSFSGE